MRLQFQCHFENLNTYNILSIHNSAIIKISNNKLHI